MSDNSLQSSTPLNVDTALIQLAKIIKPKPDVETLATDKSHGRFLVNDIHAPMNLPPFTSSAMDGYAVRAQDLQPPCRLPLQGTSAAGHPYLDPIKSGHCIRIFTGAQLPVGADTVVLQENVHRQGDAIEIHNTITTGVNVRHIGHDVTTGHLLLPAQSRINSFSLAWLAACGIPQVDVIKKPVIAIFSTGDELKTLGESLAPGQIYDGNRLVIESLLANLPLKIVDLGIIADDQAKIEETLVGAAETADVIITSGGVSVGEADFVRQALAARGSLEFWKLNLKPGKPFAYGQVGEKCHFFGLPGNPVSTIITLLLLVKPALQQLCGGKLQTPKTIPAIANSKFKHSPGRDEYQRGRYVNSQLNGHSELIVESTGDQSSNRLASFHQADCLVWIEKDRGSVEPGEAVTTLSLKDLIYD